MTYILHLSGINFGASLSAPFNTFDPLDTSGWTNLNENPVIFSTMVGIIGFYLCCLIAARKWDERDVVKVFHNSEYSNPVTMVT